MWWIKDETFVFMSRLKLVSPLSLSQRSIKNPF